MESPPGFYMMPGGFFYDAQGNFFNPQGRPSISPFPPPPGLFGPQAMLPSGQLVNSNAPEPRRPGDPNRPRRQTPEPLFGPHRRDPVRFYEPGRTTPAIIFNQAPTPYTPPTRLVEMAMAIQQNPEDPPDGPPRWRPIEHPAPPRRPISSAATASGVTPQFRPASRPHTNRAGSRLGGRRPTSRTWSPPHRPSSRGMTPSTDEIDEEYPEISAADAHVDNNHRIIVPLNRRIIAVVSQISFFDDFAGFTLTPEFTMLIRMEHKLQPDWDCGCTGMCICCMECKDSRSTTLTKSEIKENRRILLGFKFREKDLRSNAQSGLLVLAANLPMTLGIHSRVLQRIGGPGLLTLFFANVGALRSFIAHLCHRPVSYREHEDYLNLRMQETLNARPDGSGIEPFFARRVQMELLNCAGDKAIRNGYVGGGVGIGSAFHGGTLEDELNQAGGFGLGVWIGDAEDGGKGVYCAGRVLMRVSSGDEYLDGCF